MIVLKYSASNLLSTWKNYRLTDWCSMIVAGIIFVVGYFLGTLSWRTGTSVVFIVLDFIAGSAGFVYFCHKGGKIVSETLDELLSISFKEQVHLDKEQQNHAVENDYVLGQAVFSQVQESKLLSPNTMCYDSQINQSGEVFETNLKELSPLPYSPATGITNEQVSGKNGKYKDSNLGKRDINLERYANLSVSVGSYMEKVEDIFEKATGLQEEYVSGNIAQGCYVRSPTAGVQSFLKEHDGSQIDESAKMEASRKLYLAIQRPCKEKNNEDSNDYSCDHKAVSENLEPMESCIDSLTEDQNNILVYSPQRPLERFKSVSEQILYASPENRLLSYDQQRTVQSSISESFLPMEENDFLQHYQRPRSVSFLFDYSCLESSTSPDPRRHLKPAMESRKPLPPEPDNQHVSAHLERNDTSIPFLNQYQSPVIPTHQFQTPVPPDCQFQSPVARALQFESSQIQNNQSPQLYFHHFQSPISTIRQLESSASKVKRCEPLARHKSHPTILRSRSPPCVEQSPHIQQNDSPELHIRHFQSPLPTIRQYLSPESKGRRFEPLTRHQSHPITLGSRSPPRVVQSPPPRSRPSPHFRMENRPMQSLKLSPPMIPRKMRLPK